MTPKQVTQKKEYAIHSDFKYIPSLRFSFQTLIVGFINLLLRMERFVRQYRVLRSATRHSIKTEDGHDIKVLELNPAPGATPSPAIIYFHGGAYVLTYGSWHLYLGDLYGRNADCRVFLVDYRLSHRHPFPAGFNDCCAGLQWVIDNADALGVDKARIALMGDSAGGGLAASVAQWASDQQPTPPAEQADSQAAGVAGTPRSVCAQVLLYPTLDRTCSTPSALQFHNVPLWNSISNRGMWSAYLRGMIGQHMPPYAAAADRDDLSNLMPAYIETAEFDPLRDEGIDYARRLEQDGVATRLNQTSGTIHGFDTLLSSGLTRQAIAQRGQYLRAVFYPQEGTANALPAEVETDTES